MECGLVLAKASWHLKPPELRPLLPALLQLDLATFRRAVFARPAGPAWR